MNTQQVDEAIDTPAILALVKAYMAARCVIEKLGEVQS